MFAAGIHVAMDYDFRMAGADQRRRLSTAADVAAVAAGSNWRHLTGGGRAPATDSISPRRHLVYQGNLKNNAGCFCLKLDHAMATTKLAFDTTQHLVWRWYFYLRWPKARRRLC